MDHAGTAFECLSRCWVVELPLGGQGHGFDTGVSNGVSPHGVEVIILSGPVLQRKPVVLNFGCLDTILIKCQVFVGISLPPEPSVEVQERSEPENESHLVACDQSLNFYLVVAELAPFV